MAIFSPNRYRALRESAGLSRDQLAARLGKASSTIYKFEHGQIRPALTTLGASAATLGCSVADFFDDEADLAALIADDTRPSELGVEVDDWLRATLAVMPPMTDETARRASTVLFPAKPRRRRSA